MVLVSTAHGGETLSAVAAGIDAAFVGGTVITFSAFVLAIVRVGRVKRPHNQFED
jgi:hypothetical protein